MTVREEVWPSATEYNRAIKQLGSAFPDRPVLASGALVSGHAPGFPWAASGANAIVFSLMVNGNSRVAVRCFTRRPQDDVDERYRSLGNYLASNPCPVFAGFEWMEQAIVVDGKRWPILQMEWIAGDPLKQFVRQNLHRRSDIEQLSETWKDVVTELEARHIAHGDLQHGNVIVSSSSSFRLVDLDSVLCSSTSRYHVSEYGLPAYQHPERFKRKAWDHRIDRFSAIVIYVSLRAVASASQPADVLSGGDSLVLSGDDIAAAAEQNARDQAWQFLLRNPDSEVCRLAAELHSACRSRLDDVPSLAEVVRHISQPATPAAPPGSLNSWGSPETLSSSAASGGVINQWGPPAGAGDGSGRRAQPQATPQSWTDDADAHRRATPQMPQQSWGGGSTGGPTKPPSAARPARTPSTPSRRTVGQLAIALGVVLLVVGIGLAIFIAQGGFNDDSCYRYCEDTSGQWWWGLVVSGAGIGAIRWGAARSRK
jgi:hypothetical protein